MAKARLGGLGKGLDALFVENNTDGNGAVTLNIHEIEPNRDQPRKVFDEAALAELADSIRTHGILQPLLVRPMPNGRYQLIAGERRWRASRMAGLSQVPVVIREMTDPEAMELALIENLQREDLNPVEEAKGYRQLMDTYGMTQEKVAASVGKSRPVIANALRLLTLPEAVLQMLEDGRITSGHAKALLALEDPALMIEISVRAAEGHVTVREIEQLARRCKERADPKAEMPDTAARSAHKWQTEIELSTSQALGRRVRLKTASKNGKGGMLQLEFFDHEDLSNLIAQLTGQPCRIE